MTKSMQHLAFIQITNLTWVRRYHIKQGVKLYSLAPPYVILLNALAFVRELCFQEQEAYLGLQGFGSKGGFNFSGGVRPAIQNQTPSDQTASRSSRVDMPIPSGTHTCRRHCTALQKRL